MVLYKHATITGNFTVILLCILCFNLIKINTEIHTFQTRQYIANIFFICKLKFHVFCNKVIMVRFLQTIQAS